MRTMKFEGRIYLPEETDNENDKRIYLARQDGVLFVYDDNNKRVLNNYNFKNVGDMLNSIMVVREKLVRQRIKTIKQKK